MVLYVPDRARAGMFIVLACAAVSGCNRDVRLAGRKLRDVQVRTVAHYGVTLAPEASPKQVAFVLLRAIREDFEASSEAEREAALDVQFDVAAANELQKFNSLGLSRDEALFNFVYRWTPTVSHYAEQFPVEWQAAEARLLQVGPKSPAEAQGGAKECQVLIEVQDPGGDPNAGAVLVVWLVEDTGYWRVLRAGFAPKLRALPVRKTQNALPPDESTAPRD